MIVEHKQVNFIANSDDLVAILATTLTQILKRQETANKTAITELNKELLNNGTREGLRDVLSTLVKSYAIAAEEINFLEGLMNISLESSLPDTEVLEDLSDLKEDSLGVRSGSEESSTISSDHLKK